MVECEPSEDPRLRLKSTPVPQFGTGVLKARYGSVVHAYCRAAFAFSPRFLD